MNLLSLLLADPAVQQAMIGLIGLGVGWAVRHVTTDPHGGLGQLGAVVKQLIATRDTLNAHGELTDLLTKLHVTLPVPVQLPVQPAAAPAPAR